MSTSVLTGYGALDAPRYQLKLPKFPKRPIDEFDLWKFQFFAFLLGVDARYILLLEDQESPYSVQEIATIYASTRTTGLRPTHPAPNNITGSGLSARQQDTSTARQSRRRSDDDEDDEAYGSRRGDSSSSSSSSLTSSSSSSPSSTNPSSGSQAPALLPTINVPTDLDTLFSQADYIKAQIHVRCFLVEACQESTALLTVQRAGTNPAVIWTAICERFGSKGSVSIARLLMQLFETKLKSSNGLPTWMELLTQRFERLQSRGVPLPDEFRVVFLLFKLKECASLSMGDVGGTMYWSRADADKPRYNEICSLILQAYHANQLSAASSRSSTALFTSATPVAINKDIRCLNCNRRGHIAAQCRSTCMKRVCEGRPKHSGAECPVRRRPTQPNSNTRRGGRGGGPNQRGRGGQPRQTNTRRIQRSSGQANATTEVEATDDVDDPTGDPPETWLMHSADSDDERPGPEEDEPSQEEVAYVQRGSRYRNRAGPIQLSPLTPTSDTYNPPTPTEASPAPHPDYVEDPTRRPDIPWSSLTITQRMDENDYRRAYVQWTRMRDAFRAIPQGFPVPPAHWPRPWCPLGTPLNYFLPRTDPWMLPSLLVQDAPGSTGIEHIVLRTRCPRRARREPGSSPQQPPETTTQSPRVPTQSFMSSPAPEDRTTSEQDRQEEQPTSTPIGEHRQRQLSSTSAEDTSMSETPPTPSMAYNEESPISSFTVPIPPNLQTECFTPLAPTTTSANASTDNKDAIRRIQAIEALPYGQPVQYRRVPGVSQPTERRYTFAWTDAHHCFRHPTTDELAYWSIVKDFRLLPENWALTKPDCVDCKTIRETRRGSIRWDCTYCGNQEGKLKRCSGCQLVYYCNTDHQRTDWPAHKEFCNMAKRHPLINRLRERGTRYDLLGIPTDQPELGDLAFQHLLRYREGGPHAPLFIDTPTMVDMAMSLDEFTTRGRRVDPRTATMAQSHAHLNFTENEEDYEVTSSTPNANLAALAATTPDIPNFDEAYTINETDPPWTMLPPPPSGTDETGQEQHEPYGVGAAGERWREQLEKQLKRILNIPDAPSDVKRSPPPAPYTPEIEPLFNDNVRPPLNYYPPAGRVEAEELRERLRRHDYSHTFEFVLMADVFDELEAIRDPKEDTTDVATIPDEDATDDIDDPELDDPEHENYLYPPALDFANVREWQYYVNRHPELEYLEFKNMDEYNRWMQETMDLERAELKRPMVNYVLMADGNPPDVVDSACNRWLFHEKAPIDPKSIREEKPAFLNNISGKPLPVRTRATATPTWLNGYGQSVKQSFPNSLISPSLPFNLVPTPRLDHDMHKTIIHQNGQVFIYDKPITLDKKNILARGRLNSHLLYELDKPGMTPLDPHQRYIPYRYKQREQLSLAATIDNLPDLALWSVNPLPSHAPYDPMILHRALMHANPLIMNEFAKSVGRRIAGKDWMRLVRACHGCNRGKPNKPPMYRGNYLDLEYKQGEALNIDFSGPFPVMSRYGNYYRGGVTCSRSKFACDLYTPTREAKLYMPHLTRIFAFFERQSGNKLKQIRADGEFVSKVLKDYTDKHGIILKTTTRNEPNMNPFAERMNRTDDTRALAAQLDAGLPNTFWEDTHKATLAIRMVTPLCRGKDKGKSPWELLMGRKPVQSFVQPFGCLAWVKMETTKAQPVAVPGTLIGYNIFRRVYKILIHDTKQTATVEKRNVRFDTMTRGYTCKIPARPWQPLLVSHNITSSTSPPTTSIPSTQSVQWKNEDQLPQFQDSNTPSGWWPTNQLPHSSQNTLDTLDDDTTTPHTTKATSSLYVQPSPYFGSLHPPPNAFAPTPATTVAQEKKTNTAPRQTTQHNRATSNPAQHSSSAPQFPLPDRWSSNKGIPQTWDGAAITSTNIVAGPRLRKQTPANHPTHTAHIIVAHEFEEEEEEALGQDSYCLFTRVLHIPQKTIKSHPQVHAAQLAELQGLFECKALQWVPRAAAITANVPPVHTTFVDAIKTDESTGQEKYKSRLVALGNRMKEYIHYNPYECSSPTAQPMFLLLLVSYAAFNDLMISHLDFSQAYSHADMKDIAFAFPPKGYENKSDPSMILLLKKALYGTPQAGRRWFDHVSTNVRSIGYKQSTLDPCIFFLPSVTGRQKLPPYLLLRTDDLLVFHNTKDEHNALFTKLKHSFRVKDLGQVKTFCGLQFVRTSEGIVIHQHEYIKGMLRDFNFQEAKPVATPTATTDPPPASKEAMLRRFSLPRLLGALLWPATQTQPAITYAVNHAAVLASKKPDVAYSAIARILRFLRTPRGIFFPFRTRSFELISYSDANLGACEYTRRSRTGQLHMTTGPIAWSSKRQPTVALSTQDAETIANSTTCRTAIAILHMCKDVGIPLPTPSTINNDNRGAVLNATNGMATDRTRHLALKHHYVVERVRAGEVIVRHVSTKDNLADMLTKSLPTPRFLELVAQFTVLLKDALPQFEV